MSNRQVQKNRKRWYYEQNFEDLIDGEKKSTKKYSLAVKNNCNILEKLKKI